MAEAHDKEAEINRLRAARDQLLKEAAALVQKAAGVSEAIEILYGKEPGNGN